MKKIVKTVDMEFDSDMRKIFKSAISTKFA